MATYLELSNIGDEPGYSDFYERLRVAVVVKATTIMELATPTASELSWALSAITSPSTTATDLHWYVVASARASSLAQIVAASDAAVQAAVDAAVDTITSAV